MMQGKFRFIGALLLLGLSACQSPVDDVAERTVELNKETLQEAVKIVTPKADPNRYKPLSLPPQIERALSDNMVKSKRPMKRMAVTASRMPVAQFVKSLAEEYKINILVAPEIQGELTLSLQDASLDDVFDAIESLLPLEFVKRGKNGWLLRNERLMTRTVVLGSLGFKRSGTSSISVAFDSGSGGSVSGSSGGNGGVAGGSSVSTSFSNTGVGASVKETLDHILASREEQSAVYNEDSGMVTIIAYRQDMRKCLDYLDRIVNSMNKQVIIEAKIVEVELKKSYSTGVNFSSTVEEGGSSISIDPFTNLLSVATKMPAWHKQLPDGTVRNTANDPDVEGKYVPTPGTLSYALQFLSSQGRINVLASPRISTLNRHKAIIRVGDNRVFKLGTTQTHLADGSDSNNVVTTDNISQAFSGIALDITPEIQEDGHVVMHIHPLITETEYEPGGTSTSKSSSSGSDNTSESTNDGSSFPTSHVRESDSVVRAKDGQVVVIGGLLKTRAVTKHDTLPGMEHSDVYKANDSSTATELVILLQPKIVNNKTYRSDLKRSLDRYNELTGSE